MGQSARCLHERLLAAAERAGRKARLSAFAMTFAARSTALRGRPLRRLTLYILRSNTMTVRLSLAACALAFAGIAAPSHAAETVGQAASNAGHAVGEAGRKTGHAVAETGRDVGHASAETGREVGHATAEAGRKTGHAVKRGAHKAKAAAKPASAG
jgi:hypothetical protein